MAAGGAIGVLPHTLVYGVRDAVDCVFRGPALSGRAGEAPTTDHAVFAAQVAKDVHVVDERRKPLQGAQVDAAQVAGEVVDPGDVGHKIALVRVLQEKMGSHGLFDP